MSDKELTPEQEKLVTEMVEKRLKAHKETAKVKKKIVDMTKEELELENRMESNAASGLAITMQLAAANGDILAAVEARKKVEDKIKSIQDKLYESALSIAKEDEKFNKLGEEHKTLMEEMKTLKGEELEAAQEQKKELEQQQKLRVEQIQSTDTTLQANRDVLQQLNEQTKSLEDQLGAYSNLSPEAQKVAKETKGIGLAVGELAFGLVDYSKTGIGKFQTLTATIVATGDGLDGLKAGLLSAFSITNIAATAFTKVQESMVMMLTSLDKSSTEFAKATGSGEMYQSTLEDIVQENISMGVGFENASKGLQGLLENQIGFVDMSKDTQKALAAQAGMLERIGVNAETSADLMNTFSKTMGLGAEDSMALTKNLAMMGDVVGISSGKMIKDFQEANKTLAVYGKQGIKHFTNLAAAAKAAGVEMGTLLGIAGKFDTFEDAADTVGKLNALLGANMSSTEMLMMTEDQRVETLIQQMQVNGESFAQMDRFKQKALANAVGITDMAEANKIFGMSMSQYRNYSSQMDQNQLSQQKWEEAIKATVPIQEKLTAMLAKWAPKMTEWLDAITWALDKVLSGLDWLYEKSNGTFPYIVMAVGGLVVAFNGLVAVQKAALTVEAVKKVYDAHGIKAAFKKWVSLKGNTAAQIENTNADKLDQIQKKLGIGPKTVETQLTDKDTGSKHLNTAAGKKGIVTRISETASRWVSIATMKVQAAWEWTVGKAKAFGQWVAKSRLVTWARERIARWLGVGASVAEAKAEVISTGVKSASIPVGQTVAITNTEVATTGWAAAAAIAAVGLAFVGLGAGIWLAAEGISSVVESFLKLEQNAWAATLAIALLMVPFVAFIALLGVLVYTGIGEIGAAVILAIGAGFLMLGAGIGLAAYGVSFMISAFQELTYGQMVAAIAVFVMLNFLVAIFAIAGLMLANSLAALAVSAGLSTGALMALAVPLVAIGLAVGIAAWGMGEMFKGAGQLVGAFKGMGAEAYYAAFSIAALSYSFAGFAGIMMLMAIPGVWAAFAGGLILVGAAMMYMVLAFNALNTDNLNAIAKGMASLSELANNMTGMTMGVTFVGTLARDLEDLGEIVNPEVQSTLDSLVSLSANQTSETITNTSAETRAEAMVQLSQTLTNELDINVRIGNTTFVDHVKKVVRDEIDWLGADMAQTTQNIVIAGDD